MDQSSAVSAGSVNHLCVLVHGLWGNPKHLDFVASTLVARYPQDSLHVLQAKTNSGAFTYDGIELGGERVTLEIEQKLRELEEDGKPVKKLSVVGYSLGGLISRYSLGLLYHKGWFDRLEPVNFTTFATPHLGVRTPLIGIHNQLWNVIGARTLSQSGRQLFLIDSFRETGRPLLAVLAESDSVFMRALARFKHRSLYTNIVNDRSAVYYTTGISKTDPYVNISAVDINYLPGYEPVILDPKDPVRRKPVDDSVLSTALTRLSAPSSLTLSRLPFFAFLVVWLPIGMVVFFINAGVQSVRSQNRIRLHQQGKAGIPEGLYRIPLMVRRAGEDLYEDMTGSQQQEYLPDDHSDAGAADHTTPNGNTDPRETEEKKSSQDLGTQVPNGNVASNVTANGSNPVTAATRLQQRHQAEFPTLALTKDQFTMIDALDAVGWRKYPVYIHKAMHSHAAIIRRTSRKGFEEGIIVVEHWAKEFEI